MEIDWITVTAQIINFLVLVWLLKHFLYQPVIQAMDNREQRITSRLNEADERERQAGREAREFQEKTGQLEQKKAGILEDARGEAEAQKKQMLEDARKEVAGIREEWRRQIDTEKEEFSNRLRRLSSETILEITRKILNDLADAELEKRVIHEFEKRLENLDSDTRRSLSDHADSMRIISAFQIGSSDRGRLTRVVHQQLDTDAEISYSESEELICGIQLFCGDTRVGWNVTGYLDELSERIDKATASSESS